MVAQKVNPPWIKQEWERCRADPVRFNRTILKRHKLWTKQASILESFQRHPVTLCKAGNSVGKSYALAAAALHYLAMNPGAKVICTAPSHTQLREVLWANIVEAYNNCPYMLFDNARLSRSPDLKLEVSPTWFILAYSTTTAERFSGHHSARLAVIVDEASGVSREIFEAADSLIPHRMLLIGNPLRPEGVFYERCLRAHQTPGTNLITIKSTESPDIVVPHSNRGLACKNWLEKCKMDYGVGSLWWQAHVEAEFPTSGSEVVVPQDWLNACEHVVWTPSGPRRLGIDLSTGSGNDKTVLIVRDDNGILEMASSNEWDMGETARRAYEMYTRFGIMPQHVVWDMPGIGMDFQHRLESVGIHGATGFQGQRYSGKIHANLKTAAYWNLRQRLDPGGAWPSRFSISPKYTKLLRAELSATRYIVDSSDRIAIIPKEDIIASLGHSPDYADSLSMTFAYPNI